MKKPLRINTTKDLVEAGGIKLPDPMPTVEDVKKLPRRTWGKQSPPPEAIAHGAPAPVVVPVDGGRGGDLVYEGGKVMWVPPTPETRDQADAVLSERAKTYGRFVDNAKVARSLKAVVAGALLDRQDTIPDDAAEAIDMICSKMARLLSGDINHKDSWTDIEGYARLVRERIEGNAR